MPNYKTSFSKNQSFRFHGMMILMIGVWLLLSVPAYSQCSMCRAVAESGAKDETRKVARGLNSGILYLLGMPYILGGIAFYLWRKNRKKQADELNSPNQGISPME